VAAVFEIGRAYRRRDELHAEYGGQYQGGISTPAAHPIIFLFSGDEGSEYGYADEELADGTYLYFGEGQVGDMPWVRGNRAIRDHAVDGKELHLFRTEADGTRRYRGRYSCAGWEYRDEVPDVNGDPRQAIVFQLLPHAQLEEDERGGAGEVEGTSSDDLDALRAAALEAPAGNESPAEAKRRLYRRSRAVRRYVLARADGICEGCSRPAPFLRPDGDPYLEPHHTRLISDAGPDHPRWVIGLCPTCHRRVHHGADGASYNEELETRLGELEADV
jgi:5-methylcytosine-specific restriction protein A